MEEEEIKVSQVNAKKLKRESAILRVAFANRKRSERLYQDSDLAKQDAEQ